MTVRTTAGLAQADSSGRIGNESLRRIENRSGTQAAGKINLETAESSYRVPVDRALSGSLAPAGTG